MNSHWQNREQKQKSKRSKMPKHGRSLFTIVRLQVERANKIKEKK